MLNIPANMNNNCEELVHVLISIFALQIRTKKKNK